jgi:hypothetical protein
MKNGILIIVSTIFAEMLNDCKHMTLSSEDIIKLHKQAIREAWELRSKIKMYDFCEN